MTEKIAREKQIAVVLVGVLAVALLFGPVKQLRLFGRRASAPSATLRPEAQRLASGGSGWQDVIKRRVDALAAAGERRATEEPAVMAYTAHQLRDPLESLLPAARAGATNQVTLDNAADAAGATDAPAAPRQSAPPPTLQLQGVVWGGPVPRAIINHRVYGVGDMVEGALVKAIERRQVVLEFQGAAITLTNAPEPRPRTPSPGVGLQPEGGG